MSYVLGSSATNIQNKMQNAIDLTEKLSKGLHFYYLWRITLHSSASNTFNHSFPIEQQLRFSMIDCTIDKHLFVEHLCRLSDIYVCILRFPCHIDFNIYNYPTDNSFYCC